MPKLKYKDKSFVSYLLSFRVIVFLSNIVFQGIRYMSLGEKIYKISITILFSLILNVLIENIFISLIFAHLLNYVINGQFYVVFRYLSNSRTMSRDDLNKYILIIEKYINLFKPLDVLGTGSFCRGKMGKSSDLDMRIYHNSDFLSSLKAYIMATVLRAIGLYTKFPIDVYCFSDLDFLDKLDEIEIPVNFLQNELFLKKYPNSIYYKIQLEKLIIL